MLFNCIIQIAYAAKTAPRSLCFQAQLNSEVLQDVSYLFLERVLIIATIYAISHEWTPPQYTLLPVPNSEAQVWESNAADSMPLLHLEGIPVDKSQPDRASPTTLPVFCSWTSVFISCLLLSLIETQLTWKTHLPFPHTQGHTARATFGKHLCSSVTSGLKALRNTMSRAENFNLLL